MRSPVALRKFEESFERRNFWGINPSSIAREHVNGSTRPPAALVGPSVPSVATLAKHVCAEDGREAMDVLCASARKGRQACLVVTHDTRLVDFADRVLHIEDGHIAAA